MAGSYRISEVTRNEEYALLRVSSVEAEGSVVSDLNRAVSNRFPQSFINNTYVPHIGNSFYEVFLRASLSQMREIDGSETERLKFINRRFPPMIAQDNLTGGPLLPVIIMMIDFLPGDSFLDGDIEFISDILTWGPNKIFVTPLIKFDDAIPDERRVVIYNDFVRRLLGAKNRVSDRIRVAASVPAFYPRRNLEELLNLYSDENRSADMVFLDFKRERITSPRIIGKVDRIHSYFNAESTENYYIYGFNVKPHKRGAETPDAEDIGCFLRGINAIGNMYRVNNISRVFIPDTLEWKDLPRVFNNGMYKYTRLNDPTARNELIEWADINGGAISNTDAPNSHVSQVIPKFNLDKVGLEAKLVSALVREGDQRGVREKIGGKDITRLLNQ